MIFKKPSFIRSFCSCSNWSKWSNRIGFGIPGAGAALLLMSALPLSSHAQDFFLSTKVMPLPYVLSNEGAFVDQNGFTLPTVVSSGHPANIIKDSASASGSPFVGLFGGGFAAIESEFPATAGGAGTLLAIHKARIFLSKTRAEKWVQQTEQDALRYEANNKDQLAKAEQCATPNVVQANGTVAGSASSRTKARRMTHGFPRIAAADTCETQQEESADEAEEDLDALTESEAASEDAIESAEVAEEVAVGVAEEADEAIEVALEAIDIVDTIIDALEFFFI